MFIRQKYFHQEFVMTVDLIKVMNEVGAFVKVEGDKIHGKSYVNIIDDANQYSSAYIPTTNAVTQRSRVVSPEGYFASCSI